MKTVFTIIASFGLVILFNTASAQTWTAPVEPVSPLTTGGLAGQYSQLLVVNGNPAMAFYDGTRANLVFVRATDASGTAFGTPVTLDSVATVGQYISLQIVNGNPAISYYDQTNGDLKYVRATNASGTAWGTPLSIDVTGNVGQYSSLEIVNGNPAISYYDATNFDLKYVRAIDAFGIAWGTPLSIDVTGLVGQNTSLQIVNGNPAISYSDNTSHSLKYVRATDASGTTWGTPLGIDVTGNAQNTSLQIVNGNPAISYFGGSQDLKYVRATDPSGIAWGTPLSIDVTGSVGLYTSLQIVNGNPAISYYDQTNADLKYVRATDASGTAWGTQLSIDVSGDVGQFTSLQIVNGNPAISYYDVTNGDLKYTRAPEATGTTVWGTPLSIDVTGTVGQYTSLQIVNGNPAISYFDATNGDLKYVRATDAAGTAWGTPLSIDVTGFVGKYTSLQIVNGNPAISYYDVTNGDLKYVRATDAAGTAWGTPLIIDGAGNVGEYTSLQIVNGNPAISYYDVTNGDLKYVRATDASGTAWGTALSIDVTGDVGQYTSLQIVNGNPAISYYDIINADLKYVRATDASGTAWGTKLRIDGFGPAGNVGQFTCLQIVNGNPAISYLNGSSGYLKYVRATDASGTAWGTPLTVDAGGLGSHEYVGLYTSLQIVNGSPAISYYDATNFDLKYVLAKDASGTAWGTPLSINVTGNVGQYTSLQIVNGSPAISYYDVTNGDLKYLRATVAWVATPLSIDVTGTVGAFTSLQIVNGNPAISYYDATNGDLKYVRATNASGTIWGTPLSVDVTGTVGLYTSLQIVNGNPAISYYDAITFDLKYVRAANASGTAWGTPLSIAVLGSVGLYNSLQIVDGNPAISYYDATFKYLKYVRATDASGTAWGTPLSIAVTGDVGQYTSLQIVNGNPAISYYDVTNGDLKYVRATDAAGTAWGTPQSIDVTGTVGQYTSLQIVNGNPAISYYDLTNGDLKYVRATDAAGIAWGTPLSIDVTGNVGQYTSLQIINGNPAISYYDVTNGDLKYILATDASGTAWGTALTLDAPGTTGQYTSMVSTATAVAIAYYSSSQTLPYFVYGATAASASTDYYRSKTSGNWNAATTWESATDAAFTTGVINPATLTPDFSANAITIQSPHTVTVTANLTTDQTTVNSGGALVVDPGIVLVVNNGTGTDLTVNSGGSLTIRSTATGTGSIGNSAGTISGDVTVERYIASPQRAWHLLSAQAVTGTQTIKEAWQENGGAIVAGQGTLISSNLYNGSNGFDMASNSSSILIYNQGGFAGPSYNYNLANTNTTLLSSFPGYMLFVRGDRNYTAANAPATSPTVLRTSGTLTQGNQSAFISSTGTGRTLVGNPYASAIDMESIFAGTLNLAPDMYTWDPSLTGNSGVGGFRLVERTGINTYQQTPVTIPPGSPTADATARYIHSGQAFFLHTTGSAGTTNATVQFTESTKSSAVSTVNPFVGGTDDQQLIVNLMKLNPGNGESLADGIRVRFAENYVAAITDDVEKMGNFGENISSFRNNKKFIVEKRPMIAANDTIFLKISNTGIKDYRFQLGALNFAQPGVTAFLQDTYLNRNEPIDLSGAINNIDFKITSDPASAGPDRFRIIFNAKAIITPPVLTVEPGIKFYPNPVTGILLNIQFNNMNKGIYQVQLINGIGQTVLTQKLTHTGGSANRVISLGNTANGNYRLEILQPGGIRNGMSLMVID